MCLLGLALLDPGFMLPDLRLSVPSASRRLATLRAWKPTRRVLPPTALGPRP